MAREGDSVEIEVGMMMLELRQDDDGEVVHTFLSLPSILLGADWSVAEVRREAALWGGFVVAGPAATSLRHGLAIRRPESAGGTVFLETREEET